ncbi:MAG: hypothetical protein NTZ13_01370 [Candidatus Parcubacteria bacterium]|nr:hypothetical protein [Candidatus Parcubacteria bacterium]
MQLAIDILKRINLFYVNYGRNSNEKVLITYFNMTQGQSAESVQNSLNKLFQKDLITRASSGEKEEISTDIIPTSYTLGLLDDYTVEEIFFNRIQK